MQRQAGTTKNSGTSFYNFQLFLTSIFIFIFSIPSFACDKSSATLDSETDNGDGTYTYVITSCTEFLGLDPTPYSFSFTFSGGTVISVSSATPASVTTGTSDVYNRTIAGLKVTYTNSGFLPSNNTNTFCNTYTITTVGRPATITVKTNENSASAVCTKTLTIPSCANVLTYPASTFCNTGTATPTTATPAGGTYTANLAGLSINSSTGVIDLAASTAGSYTVTYATAGPCTATASITINSIPNSPGVTSPQTYCQNDVASALSATASGGGTLNWYGTNASGGTASGTSPTPSTASAGTTSYYVSQTVNGCESARSQIDVTVNLLPAAPSVNPVNPGGCNGNDGSISILSPTGGGFQYSNDGGATYSLTNPNVTFSNLPAGNYDIVVMDNNGCVSPEVNVLLSSPGNPSAPIVGIDTNYCSNEQFAYIVASAGNGGTINWYSDVVLTNLIATTDSILPTNQVGTTTYYATEIVNGCESPANSVDITIKPSPSLFILQKVDESCTGNNDGYVVVNASGGTVNNGKYYFAIDGESYSIVNLFPQPGNQLQNGFHYITVQDSLGCTDTVNTDILPAPDITFIVDPTSATICQGQSVMIVAQGYSSFNWYNNATSALLEIDKDTVFFSPTATTTYRVVAIPCPMKQETTTITVLPAISIASISDTTLCLGESASFIINASGGTGNYSFTWNPVPDFINSIGDSISTSPVSDMSYEVIISDGCSPSDTANFSINVNPLPQIQLNSETFVCEGTSLNLINDLHQAEYTSYDWSFGDATISKDIESTSHVYLEDGVYTVTLTVKDTNACINTDSSQVVQVNPKPDGSTSHSPYSANSTNPFIQFYSNVSSDVSSYNWNFSGLNNSTEANPMYEFPDAGLYPVSLIISNGACFDTISDQVYIENDYDLWIPSAFTPNNDGDNDVFIPEGFGIADFEMEIFDRWGELIFTTESFIIPWEGVRQGGIYSAPDGVYVYRIKYTPYSKLEDAPIKVTGHVSLLR